MNALLVADSGHAAELVASAPMIVGSGQGVHIPVREGLGVAARHFEIQPCVGTFQIRTLSSDAPVMVNDQPVQVAMLWDGDVISAGQLRLTFRAPAQTAEMKRMSASVPFTARESSLEHIRNVGQSLQKQPVLQSAQLVTEVARPLERLPTSQLGSCLPLQVNSLKHAGEFGSDNKAETTKQREFEKVDDGVLRTLPLEVLNGEEDFNAAFLAASVAIVLGGVACFYAFDLPWYLHLAVAAVVGIGTGIFVRFAGKGMGARFGRLAAAAGMLAVLAASVVMSQLNSSRHYSRVDAINHAQHSVYAGGTEMASAAQRLREHMALHPGLFDPTALDGPDSGADMEVPKAMEQPSLESHDTIGDASATELPFFSLQTWFACLLSGLGARYVAFRRADGIDKQQSAPKQSVDTSHLTLRQRLVLSSEQWSPKP